MIRASAHGKYRTGVGKLLHVTRWSNTIQFNKITQMSSNESLLINLDGILNKCNESCLRLDSDISIEEATCSRSRWDFL